MKISESVARLRWSLLGAAMAIGFSGLAIAQPATVGDPIEIKGKIAQYSLNLRGVVDGLILADGAELRIPRHISTELAFVARPGDAVTIRGFKTTASPDLRVSTVTNDATGVVVDAGPSATPSKINVESRIKLQLHDTGGRLDGVLLDDGTVVRMPPIDAEQHAAALAVGLPLFVNGDGISTPLGKVIAAHEIGPNQTDIAKIDDTRFERWMQEQGTRPLKEGVDANKTDATKAVLDRLKTALATHGISVTMDGEQAAGRSLSVSIGSGSGQTRAEGGSGADRADTEIATQSNAPLVIKSSGPATIDIGAIIMNTND
jgi:hypothetical protein